MNSVPFYKNNVFWTAVVALIINVATFLAAHYITDPTLQELALKILLPSIDAILGILITAFTVQTITKAVADYKLAVARENNQAWVALEKYRLETSAVKATVPGQS